MANYVQPHAGRCSTSSYLSSLSFFLIFFISPLSSQITIDFDIDPPKCFSYTDGSVVASISGGVAPYSVEWNTGSTATGLYGIGAGTYSVSVTDANGDMASASVTVTDPTAVEATVNLLSDVCARPASIEVTASGGAGSYTYVWSNGSTTSSLTDLPSGQYCVTVSDGNWCIDVACINIPMGLTLTLESLPPVCPLGCDGSAAAIVTGGTAPYTYRWSNGATTSVNPNLLPGVFSVTVTDANGCTVEGMVTVEDGVSDISAEITFDNPDCEGTGSASVTADGGVPPYTFVWNTGQTEATLTDLDAGNYTVTVTDANGCTAVASAELIGDSDLDVAAELISYECGDQFGSITVIAIAGIPPYTYAWSTGQTGPTATNLTPGALYEVSVTDFTGCTVVASFPVVDPDGLDFDLEIDNPDCAGLNDGEATVTPPGDPADFNYTWSNGSMNQTATFLGPGDYSVTVYDNMGCGGIKFFEIEAPEELSVDVMTTDADCGEAFGTATAVVSGGTEPYTIKWSDGQMGAMASNLVAGTYTVIVTDANECETMSLATVEGSGAVSCSISGDQLVCPREVVTYTLDVDGNCDNPQITWSLQADSDGTIISEDGATVTLQVDNDCEGWLTLIATVQCEGCPETVCQYPVDVVLTDVILDCPDDVTIDACTSASEIDAAFADFLAAFSAEGGCGATGSFDDDYSAPDACGGSVTVSYTATDDCGQSETCSATFTVETCTDGSCEPCGASCSISGDQLLCPREVVTYTLDLDGNCVNPQISWSLQADSDGTIISEDGATVTVQVDNDCEGWLTIVATVQCEGCPEVVCQYPVDVVLTDVILDCPDDVTVDACSSQEDVDAMFADFLNAFSFSGGCGGDGSFEDDYTAPDVCTGGSVSVTFTVTDDCDQVATCTAVFTVPACSTGECEICINITDPGEIAYNGGPLCGPGNDPPAIISIAPASGGEGGEIQYMWMKSTKSGTFSENLFEPIPNSNSPSYDPGPLQETTYFARCARREDCPAFLETNVVKIEVGDDAVARITPPELICSDQPVVFMAEDNGPGATYSWDFGATSNPRTSNEINPVVTYTNFGIRTVTLTVENNGCTSTDEIKISIINGGPDCSTPSLVAFFPNPFKQILQVEVMEGNPNQPMQLQIETLYGQRMQAYDWPAGVQKHEINTSDLPAGVYVARLTIGDGKQQTYMIVKQEK